MKIITICHQCGPNEEAALIEIRNDNIHKVTCDKGHEFSLLITQQKHEILFEVATRAIVDGYHREAISTFAASLERYYEFFVKVISVSWQRGQFEKAWKHVASQSERQLGGYIFTYVHVIGESPEILSQPMVKLRNSVVHKGTIPSRKEAISFGVEVAKIINDGCNLLHTALKGNITEIIRQTICHDNIKNYKTLVLSTYLNCLNENYLVSFEEYVNSVQTHNKPRFDAQ